MSQELVSCPTCQTPNFTPRGLKAHKCRGVNRHPAECEVLSAGVASQAELRQLAEAIDASIDLVTQHEGAFEEATLEHRLQIGLHVSRAMEVFVSSVPNPSGRNQHSKEVVSRRDITPEHPPMLSNSGFVSWLAKEIPRLKRPTAYKYATAFRVLGLPVSAGAAQIRAKIKDLRHQAGKAKLPMPTLAGLLKQAPRPPKLLELPPPPDTQQLRIEDAREAIALWQDAWRALVKAGHLEYLPPEELPAVAEFIACCRDSVKARLRG